MEAEAETSLSVQEVADLFRQFQLEVDEPGSNPALLTRAPLPGKLLRTFFDGTPEDQRDVLYTRLLLEALYQRNQARWASSEITLLREMADVDMAPALMIMPPEVHLDPDVLLLAQTLTPDPEAWWAVWPLQMIQDLKGNH